MSCTPSLIGNVGMLGELGICDTRLDADASSSSVVMERRLDWLAECYLTSARCTICLDVWASDFFCHPDSTFRVPSRQNLVPICLRLGGHAQRHASQLYLACCMLSGHPRKTLDLTNHISKLPSKQQAAYRRVSQTRKSQPITSVSSSESQCPLDHAGCQLAHAQHLLIVRSTTRLDLPFVATCA